MYARYLKSAVPTGGNRYILQDDKHTHLFGCNNGLIPRLLARKLARRQDEPYKWHVSVVKELAAHPDYLNSTLIIDLKPKQEKTNLSLYEVMDVWGYSCNRWTPIMLRLQALFVDQNPSNFDREDFSKDAHDEESIYEFLYLKGSIGGGKLVGTWVAPPASPTNAALLWPETLNYFFNCIRATTPEILDSKT